MELKKGDTFDVFIDESDGLVHFTGSIVGVLSFSQCERLKELLSGIAKPAAKTDDKALKDEFAAFVRRYKSLTGRATRSVATEFKDFSSRHRDWRKVVPLLTKAIEREAKARDEAKLMRKFFPEPKMLQTYLGRQRAWEMYVGTDDDSSESSDEYKPQVGGALSWNDHYGCYMYTSMYFGYIPDGYEDDDRPDGARIMLNNGRGYVVWNKNEKEWLVVK